MKKRGNSSRWSIDRRSFGDGMLRGWEWTSSMAVVAWKETQFGAVIRSMRWIFILPEEDVEELVISRRRNCFLCFIRRFWNQVFTCVSLNPKAEANSTLSGVDKYLVAGWTRNGWKIFDKCEAFSTASPLPLEALLQAGQLGVGEYGSGLPPAAVPQGTHTEPKRQLWAAIAGKETRSSEYSFKW